MPQSNLLLSSPPFQVKKALSQLGLNLRTARLRRRVTIKEAAQQIGTGPRAVMDAERGKPSTAVAVYIALLWLYRLSNSLDVLADPTKDTEGIALELRNKPVRSRRSSELDNDF